MNRRLYPKKLKAFTTTFFGLTMLACQAGAQSYTVESFVKNSDALIVAQIVSKEAVRMEVQTRQPSGRISTGTGISTKYGIAISEDFGSERSKDIHEFVLPGGELDGVGERWTHTPELHVGMEVLVSLEYDELNDYYIPNGIPPVGRDAGTFLVIEEQGSRILIPYRRYNLSDPSASDVDFERVKLSIDSKTKMLELADSAANFDAFSNAVREVRNEK